MASPPSDLDGLGSLLRDTVRHLVAAGPPAELVSRLSDAGWDELVAADEGAAIGALFEELGRSVVASPALDLVVAGTLDLDPTEVRIGYPVSGASTTLVVGGVPGPGLDLVILGGTTAAPGRYRPESCTITAVEGIDPAAGLGGVLAVAGAEPLEPLSGDEVERGLTAARRALAAQLLGSAQQELDLACEHARDRHQFGRPIGSFQAVRHRLADAFVALTAARAALVDAWETEGAHEAVVAKALAGRAAATAGGAAQQVLAGMGFTWEHDLHRLQRRSLVLDVLAGSATSLAGSIGAAMLATGSIPRTGTFLLPI